MIFLVIILFHYFDDIIPHLYWSEVFFCPQLDHCRILDPILMCPEFRTNLFCQVYSAADVQELASFPVELYFPLSVGCVFNYSPLWGLWSTRMIACQRKSSHDELSCGCDQVGVLFPVNV